MSPHLHEAVKQRVRALGGEFAVLAYELIAVIVASTARRAEIYTSASPPPGMSRRRFNELARASPNAKKVGRQWQISAAQIEIPNRSGASPDEPAAERDPSDAPRIASPASRWSADAALRDAGARPTRGRR